MIAQRNDWQMSVEVWLDSAEAEYMQWLGEDPEESGAPKPKPSFVLSKEESAQLVVVILQGHVGESGPQGPAGISAAT